jgi:hypothetical protein
LEKLDQSLLLRRVLGDSEISATGAQFVQKEVLDRHSPDRLRGVFAFFTRLEIGPKSTIRQRTPMTIIARLRDLFGAEKTSGDASSSLCCDHCSGKLRFPAYRYWRMRFCSVACMNTYQQRLSPDTQQKNLRDRWLSSVVESGQLNAICREYGYAKPTTMRSSCDAASRKDGDK